MAPMKLRPPAPPPELPDLPYLALVGQKKTAAVRAERVVIVSRLLDAARRRKDRVMFPEWAVKQRDAGALFAVSSSGGKDSMAIVLRTLEFVPRDQIVVIHADLHEVEWPGTMELAREQAERHGLPFLVARAVDAQGRDKSFYTAIEQRAAAIARMARELAEQAAAAQRAGQHEEAAELLAAARKKAATPVMPGMQEQMRYCTADLKVGPIQRVVGQYAEAHGFHIVVEVVGVRSDESDGRESAFPLVLNRDKTLDGTGTKARRNWYKWNAIQHLLTDTVQAPQPDGPFGIIAAAGERWHYAYDLGSSRLSCVFCIFAKESEYRLGATHNPDIYEQIDALEQRLGQTFKPGKTVREIVGASPEELKARAGRSLPVLTGRALAESDAPPAVGPGAVVGRNLATGAWSKPLEAAMLASPMPEGMDATEPASLRPDGAGGWTLRFRHLERGELDAPMPALVPAGSLVGAVALLPDGAYQGGVLPLAAFFLRGGT